MSLISWCIIYDTQFIFYSKIEKATLKTNLIFWSFSLGSKLNFLADLIKSKKCKKKLKYLLEWKIKVRQNLDIVLKLHSSKCEKLLTFARANFLDYIYSIHSNIVYILYIKLKILRKV